MLEGEAKAKDQGHRCKCTRKKKDLQIFFHTISKKKKNGFQKEFFGQSPKTKPKKNKKRSLQRFWRFHAKF